VNVSTASGERPASEDLTAQARIRNAAIAEFAVEGFLKATVRDIAAAAGVSPALVIHHFGSKAGLREVCDAYVLETLLQRARGESSAAGVRDGLRDYLANPAEFHLQGQYMVRAIDENSPTADRFVEALLAESENVLSAGIADGSIRPTSDLRAMAVLTLVISQGLLSMPPAVVRALGHEALNPEVMRRMAAPSLELYTYGIYTDDTLLRSVHDALDDPLRDTTNATQSATSETHGTTNKTATNETAMSETATNEEGQK
jgi:TetR/AcrR family transcriptional regulator, regulator of cefoperazone and chloramphenicol sensitivity